MSQDTISIGSFQKNFLVLCIGACLTIFSHRLYILIISNVSWNIYLNYTSTLLCFIWFIYKYLRVSKGLGYERNPTEWIISFLIFFSGLLCIYIVEKPILWFGSFVSLFFFSSLKDLQIVLNLRNLQSPESARQQDHHLKALIEKLIFIGVLVFTIFLIKQGKEMAEIGTIFGSIFCLGFVVFFFTYSLIRFPLKMASRGEDITSPST